MQLESWKDATRKAEARAGPSPELEGEPLRTSRTRILTAAKPVPVPAVAVPTPELPDGSGQVLDDRLLALLAGIAEDARAIRGHLFWIALPIYIAMGVLAVAAVVGFVWIAMSPGR
jgi:hypothetical protein